MADKKPRRCAGFPPHDDCQNEAGTPWTDLWCPRCDALRRAEIGRTLEEILRDMDRQEAN